MNAWVRSLTTSFSRNDLNGLSPPGPAPNSFLPARLKCYCPNALVVLAFGVPYTVKLDQEALLDEIINTTQSILPHFLACICERIFK